MNADILRALVLVVCMAAGVPPAVAADAALPGPRGAPFNMTILGKEFVFKPYRLEGPARSWADVKPYLPRALFEMPREPMTDRQIAQRVDALLRGRLGQYEAALEKLTDKHLEDFRKVTPAAEREFFQLVLAESCISNISQGYISGPVLRLCQEYTALLYVSEMLREATGINLTYSPQ
jgi:hypothetical protein